MFCIQRMFDAYPPDNLDGCFVRISIGWLTAYDYQMFTSHMVVDRFYSNIDPCFVVRKPPTRDVLEQEEAAFETAGESLADPRDVIEFKFRQI